MPRSRNAGRKVLLLGAKGGGKVYDEGLSKVVVTQGSFEKIGLSVV